MFFHEMNLYDFPRPTPEIDEYDGPKSNVTKLNGFLEYAARTYTNKHVLPVINSSEAVRVKFHVSLHRIVDLDEKSKASQLVC